ncbi:hypothetical protein [Rhizobium sp. YTU87027]|uniref:hypothetical protein n=1 Tax=Rhizobium sp. YTU87027 TaxID=3417741 RepID=UPI003D68A6D8
MKTIEALQENIGDVFRFGEAKVDCNSCLAVVALPQGAPADEVAAMTAEVEGKGPRTTNISRECIGLVFDVNSLAVILISPQNAVPPANGAVTDRGIRDGASKLPVNRSAMARTAGYIRNGLLYFVHGHGNSILRYSLFLIF